MEHKYTLEIKAKNTLLSTNTKFILQMIPFSDDSLIHMDLETNPHYLG